MVWLFEGPWEDLNWNILSSFGFDRRRTYRWSLLSLLSWIAAMKALSIWWHSVGRKFSKNGSLEGMPMDCKKILHLFHDCRCFCAVPGTVAADWAVFAAFMRSSSIFLSEAQRTGICLGKEEVQKRDKSELDKWSGHDRASATLFQSVKRLVFLWWSIAVKIQDWTGSRWNLIFSTNWWPLYCLFVLGCSRML